MIHIVESLDVGAVETWLLRMLRAGRTSGEQLDWTFYSVLPRPGRFDDTARQLGATVINSPVGLNEKVAFVRHLRRTLRNGNFDVMHCHHDVVSAVYLVASAGLGVPRRIVHVHNADLHVPTGSPRRAALLREPMRRVCLRLANRIVGISNYTLDTFLHGRARLAHRDVVLYYGIDTLPFHAARPNPRALRQSLGLPDVSRILLFVGRMVGYKNPLFLVDILAEIAASEPNAYAVFAGAGPLEDQLRDRAKVLGIADRILVLGWRDDIIALMQSSDVFVFPREEKVTTEAGTEGLGLVVVEAQAAGLPSILSRGVPDDAIVLKELCDVVPLSAGPAEWGVTVRRILARSRNSGESALATIENSPFSLDAGYHNLTALHEV